MLAFDRTIEPTTGTFGKENGETTSYLEADQYRNAKRALFRVAKEGALICGLLIGIFLVLPGATVESQAPEIGVNRSADRLGAIDRSSADASTRLAVANAKGNPQEETETHVEATALEAKVELAELQSRRTEAASSSRAPDRSTGRKTREETLRGVADRVEEWLAAWSNRQVDGYLASYSRDFRPAGGMSQDAWLNQRKARVAGKSPISIRVDRLTILVSGGGRAEASFVQSYESESYRDRVAKTLILVQEAGEWKIVEERVSDTRA